MKYLIIKHLLIGLLCFTTATIATAQPGAQQQAIDVLKGVLAADPNNYDYLMAYGGVLETDYPLVADSVYRKAISVNPERSEAYHNLAGIYILRGMRLDQEGDQATDAEKKQQLKATANESYQTALPWMEKAHAKNPQDQSALRTLVSLCARLGLKEQETAYKSLIK